jgi:amino acid permease
LVVAILTFAGGMVGLYLQRLLPEQHSVEKARDMIGSVMGLVTLLLALVLGTIVGSAYYFSSTQQNELQALASQQIQLDEALAQFGPEAKPARDQLKGALDRAHKAFWGDKDVDPEMLSVATAIAGMQAMSNMLHSLDAKTPEQKAALASALAHFGQIENTRLLMSLQLTNPFSRPLLAVVVFWSFFLFCGFGLLSRVNATTIAALAFGAFAVGSAIFLILELSQPYTGLFRISPAALEQTIDAIDK